MKIIFFALIAAVSGLRTTPKAAVKAAPAAPAPPPLTWNYKSTGGHPSVNRLPNKPKTPVVAPFRLGGDGPANVRTGTINEP